MQSMLLAPIAGIGVLTCTYYALTRRHYKKLFYLFAVMCAGSMLFAASRSSLIATICGEMALFYFFSEKTTLFSKRIIIILLVGVLTYPLWNEALEGTENAINVHISNLRKKIAAIDNSKSYIKTVWGIGFKMDI